MTKGNFEVVISCVMAYDGGVTKLASVCHLRCRRRGGSGTREVGASASQVGGYSVARSTSMVCSSADCIVVPYLREVKAARCVTGSRRMRELHDVTVVDVTIAVDREAGITRRHR